MQVIVLVSNIPTLVSILTVLVMFVLFCFVLFCLYPFFLNVQSGRLHEGGMVGLSLHAFEAWFEAFLCWMDGWVGGI